MEIGQYDKTMWPAISACLWCRAEQESQTDISRIVNPEVVLSHDIGLGFSVIMASIRDEAYCAKEISLI